MRKPVAAHVEPGVRSLLREARAPSCVIKRWLSIACTCLTLLYLAAFNADDAEAEPTVQGVGMLFSPALDASRHSALQHPRLRRLRDDPAVIDYWVVEVQSDLLEQADSLQLNLPDLQASGVARSLPPLLNDVHVEQRARDDFTWFGEDPSTGSRAVLVVREAEVYGSIHSQGKSYRLRPLSGGLHTLSLMNPEPPFRLEPPVLENLHEGRRLPKSEQPAATPQQATSADAPFEYTVLVAYTEAAKRTEGDSSAVEAVAQLVVDETNESYRNSDLALRTRLAHVYEESHYTEGTIFQDLNRLRNINDGFLDDVHVYRNRYHADVVVLFVDQVSGYGGVATLLASQATAFAVVASPAAASDSVSAFAHEIGHLQGAHHNREQSLNGFFSYGHGYCDQRHGWRTVMAYAIFAQRNGSQVNLCPDDILQWSNPDVTFDGDSTGPNRAVTNNARVLRETANKIAKFRTSIPVSSSLIEGSFGIPYGNFEIVVWDESELIHFFRDNNRAGLPWIRGQTFAQRIRSTPSLIQGTFGRDFSGDFSNFEVVVREGRFLRHYFRDNNLPDLPWEEGVLFGNNVYRRQL